RGGIGGAAPPISSVGGPETLDELLRRADALAITVPLTPATRGLLGARELALMKRTALIVNVARAEIVDEDALYQALQTKALGGAALDVWYRYPAAPGVTPPANRPFHALPNVLMTPHVAGWTEGTLDGRARIIAGNIARVARGETPVNALSVP
ncbi:MAG: hydroxyacid dehydrogenase, partial [Candidatus Rokubacteria bacterium]|nr:hydroxyacid dehydrogenase [Candidatus Rokubacteria bacterium]